MRKVYWRKNGKEENYDNGDGKHDRNHKKKTYQ